MLFDYLRHRIIGTPVEPLAVTLRNMKLRRKSRKHPEISEALLEATFFEEIFREFVTDGTNCVDAGAHLGAVLSIFTRLSPSGRHVAFEPTPYKARWLRKRFPRAEVRETALLDHACERQFYHFSQSSAYSGLQVQKTTNARTDNSQVLSVRCETLDDAVGNRHIGFMKIDVEGAELLALKGADRILNEFRPPMLFECTKSGLDAFGHHAADAHAMLVGHDYDIYMPRPKRLRQRPLDAVAFERAMVYPFQAWNFLAIPRA